MQTAVAESWGVPTNAGAYDPLLASLVHVTGLLGRPWSAEALSAGLPVPETGLTPELFVRAAARAGVTPESYYLVRIRTSQVGSGAGERSRKVILGMQATVDIRTGRRTVLQYRLKPVLRAKENALRER